VPATARPAFKYATPSTDRFRVFVDGAPQNLTLADHVELIRYTSKETATAHDTLSSASGSGNRLTLPGDANQGWCALSVDATYFPVGTSSYYYIVRVYTTVNYYYDCPRLGREEMTLTY
jgi:hypothetical protein